MTLIAFPDSTRYDFAAQFINRLSVPLLKIKPKAQSLEIETQQSVITLLLERIRDNRGVVFPYIGSGAQHSWIITAPTKRELEVLVTRTSRFVLPTYAAFDGDARRPLLQRFHKEGNRLQSLGSQIYPAGYYSWRAPAQHLQAILYQLNLWLQLEKTCPDLSRQHHPTYRTLRETFQTALTATNWIQAEHCIEEMKRFHLVTADNSAFLQIQLLAQQQRWSDIWQHPDFPHLARLRMPGAVRGALLTAFHAQMLLSLEQQGEWKKALETFQAQRTRLGSLLTGRFHLQQAPVLLIFAYQAALNNDRDSLEQLQGSASSQEARDHLEQIKRLFTTTDNLTGPQTSSLSSDSPLQLARQAIALFDYDAAVRIAHDLDLVVDKVLLYTQIAFHSGDLSLAIDALLLYEELSAAEKQHLEEQYPFFTPSLKHLAEQVNHPLTLDTATSVHAQKIHNWLDWFALVREEPSRSDLQTTLEYVKQADWDDAFWTIENVNQLNSELVDFMSNGQLYQRVVLRALVDRLLQHPGFPRQEMCYGELYDTLFMCICDLQEVNQDNGFMLLRLAEAKLQQDSHHCESVFQNIYKWCPDPIPALETWILETFDLFAEYNLYTGLLISWYRNWLQTLLHSPGRREITNLVAWRLFGEWIQPGDDLLQQLQKALTHLIEKEDIHPIAELPRGYQIGILTLGEAAAQRAKKILLERNKHLKVQICVAKDLNDQAKAIARNSDMVVVVTTCITHALTYGIGPYLNTEPVYPRSRGSTSIVQAIEERVRKFKLV